MRINIYKYNFVFCLFFLYSFIINGQEYNVADIPDSLRSGAFAVVRNHSTIFRQSDINNATYRVTKVITILSKQGEPYANFHIYGDKFRELSSFSANIRDASGKIVKKLKKGDLTFSSVSSDAFATDNYDIFYECKLPSYPFTVEYIYEEKWKNGIVAYPFFSPVDGYSVAVEKAEYQLELPESMTLRCHGNYVDYLSSEKIAEKSKNLYFVSLNNKKAIEYEPYAPAYWEVFPYIWMAPTDFCYDSHCGSMKDWKSYGLWVNGLLKDRDNLPLEMVNKLKDMVQGVSDIKEKTRIIFEYLQNNTRYVSIQLGIGGFQPAPAQSVIKSKLGDCKGLTNLMRAMLKSVGISSNYSEISTRNKDIRSDFPSFNQTNHVVLLVPFQNDSIWLECTNQTLPFGYVHRNIAGHDAVVMTEKGGQICKLPSYLDEENRTETMLRVVLDENGGAKGTLNMVEMLDGYENTFGIYDSKDMVRITSYINKVFKLPNVRLSDINASHQKSSSPCTILNTQFETEAFANKTGSRLFVPMCPLTKSNFNVFSASTRDLDIQITNGFSEKDTIMYTIPESHIVESLPKDIELRTPFGVYFSQIRKDGNQIVCIQGIDIFSGKYDRTKYEDIKDFFAQISSASKRKLVLKKGS